MATWSKIITTADDSDYKNSNVKETWCQQFGGKIYLRGTTSGRQIWNTPSTGFGPSYYYWNSYFTTNNNTGYTTWLSSYHPCIIAPWDGVITEIGFNFNVNSTNTVRFLLMKGTPNLGTTTSTSLSKVGNGMTTAATGSRQYFYYETPSTNNTASKGDILIPQFSKTTNLSSSTTRYLEGVMMIRMEKS